ncbi:GntR family transcriptional regulator [Isoptericola sp. NPDC019693]|uniref:GntR family transcriptional regulator n=1 Tax=Isoptericola sp. NPDC019693 TaxID=3364009 RepID=UPI00378B9891
MSLPDQDHALDAAGAVPAPQVVSRPGQLYRTLRDRIITGVYAQGERLPEQRLATDLDVSRIPLREALPRLESDGLITTLPRRSAVVTTWTTDAVHHLFDARLAIEVAAAGHAARIARRDGTLELVERALLASEEQTRLSNELGFADANADFHAALVEASGNPILSALMRGLTSRMAWLFLLTAQRDHETACREHREIVETVRSGNERLAEATTYTHIEAGREPSITSLRDRLGS